MPREVSFSGVMGRDEQSLRYDRRSLGSMYSKRPSVEAIREKAINAGTCCGLAGFSTWNSNNFSIEYVLSRRLNSGCVRNVVTNSHVPAPKRDAKASASGANVVINCGILGSRKAKIEGSDEASRR